MSEFPIAEWVLSAPSVYMAARYSRRLEAHAVITALREMNPGVESTARWLHGNHRIDDKGLSAEAEAAERQRFAMEDWSDLLRADWCILLTEPPRSAPSRGGRHVEFGAALALQKRCIVIGPAENVFCCLPQVERYQSTEAFLECLCEEAPQSIPVEVFRG